MASIRSFISGFNVDKLSQFIFIVIFFAITTAPIVVEVFKVQSPVEKIVENRTLALPPNFQGMATLSASVDQSLKWYNDHFGLRSLLIRIKNQIDYSVFGTSNRVHIGRDGWLFLRSVIDVEEPRIESMTDADMDSAIQLIGNLRDFLAKRNIELVVITNQMKDRFYPEYVPPSAQFALSRHRFEYFKTKLNELKGITYIDSTPLLLQVKTQRQIFHKTDFHWNDPAAFEVAKVLVDHLADAKKDPNLKWHLPLGIERKSLSGGEAQFMPLLSPLKEDALLIAPIPPDQATPVVYEKREPFEVFHASESTKSLLPPMVVFGDSFMDGVDRSGLPQHVKSEYRARIYHATMNEILRSMPSDTQYFVFEFIENALPNLKNIIGFDAKTVEGK